MIGWAFETLIASAILMGVVLLVRDRVAAAFGARVAYLLWLLPFARMLLPRLPEAARPAVALPIDLSMFDAAAPAPVPDEIALDAALPPPPPPGLLDWLGDHWPMLVLAVWLGGAVVHLGWQVGVYRYFVRAALRGSKLLCRSCGIAVHRGRMSAGRRRSASCGGAYCCPRTSPRATTRPSVAWCWHTRSRTMSAVTSSPTPPR